MEGFSGVTPCFHSGWPRTCPRSHSEWKTAGVAVQGTISALTLRPRARLHSQHPLHWFAQLPSPASSHLGLPTSPHLRALQ